MSFDQLSVPEEKESSVGGSDDPTAEVGTPARVPGGQDGPVSFIRESWLRPPTADPRGQGDTDRLPVIDRRPSLNLPARASRLMVTLALVVGGLIAGLGYLAVHNGHVAAKWHQQAVAQVAMTQKVRDQLKQANDHITTLDGTVGTLQGQLATVTSQEKANSGFGGTLRRLLWPFG
jgi:hypothetical protein